MQDTHRAVRALEKAGASTKLAEAMVDVTYHANGVATKEDLEKLEERVTNIENRMATKDDIKSLRWMMGVSFTVITLLLSAITIILILE